MRAVYYPQNLLTLGPDSNPVTTTVKYLAPVAAVVNNIAQSQSLAAAGPVTLNGTTVVSGVAVLDVQRQVIITSAANDSGITFTIVGTRQDGVQLSEVLTGASGAAATSANSYKTIISIVGSGATAGTIQVGTNGVATSLPIVIPVSQPSTNITLSVKVTGTVNYTVSQTFDNPFVPNPDVACTWTAITALSAQTTAQTTTSAQSAEAYRMTINSNTPPGGAQLIVVPTTSALSL